MAEKTYEELLDKAIENLPEVVFEKQRFEIPKVAGHFQGNRTVIGNFIQIAQTFRRRPEHFLKYLLKELAAPGALRGQALLLGTKIPASKINEKVRKYANEFVLCSDCGKPDTELLRDGNVSSLKCNACGVKHAIKTVV
ncbi:translation initiation factor IF-2 subunit beta [Candidatus Woesearchaeota archaeon]|nr:translation initiation factor IF-2 subunit beta [Candidatus Woesearchaeota archaeon]